VGPHDRLILVTGGARSGKSTFAERLATALAEEHSPASGAAASRVGVTYLATSEANDAEMASRVAAHRAARPAAWATVECPLDVPAVVRARAGTGGSSVFLMDCVTFWVSNLIFSVGDLGGTDPGDGFNYDKSLLTASQEAAVARRIADAVDDLLAALAETGVTFLAVSNEVGLGVVPEYPLARLYRDQLGWANQRLAALADRVFFLVSGIPLDLRALTAPWPSAPPPGPHAPPPLSKEST
jgi:adenosylcobinamide kinase/adenosylcobinamide-phosphate guanylyltransferase